MIQKEIIINSSTTQTRVAITEDSKLVDFFVESSEKRRTVGDVYLGKVARVLPGIKAAFIEIGQKHDAFLHFSDIGDRLDALQGIFTGNITDDIYDDDDDDDDNGSSKNNRHINIEAILSKIKKGNEILVQVIKEPVGNKGVRVTSSISLPGRFCVLLPFDKKVGISKKIQDFKERRRLRRLARSVIPRNCGLIIRTAAQDQTEEALESDLKFLMKTWEQILHDAQKSNPPKLLYEDVSTTISVFRDFFTPDIQKVFVDSKKMFKEIRNYLKLIQPEYLDKIEYYKDDEPIFETFGLEEQIKTMMGRKVFLPSGGHIVIEPTEAMYVIDVNSGRYAAKKEQELNSLKTDLEASREIVRQLRLRDIGGLIVVDFIDLADDKNRKKIYDELKKEFKKDRAKTALLPMTDFGLIQITRQRIRENIIQSTNEVCPYCRGTGLLTKRSNLIHDIEDWLKRYKMVGNERKLVLHVNPHLGRELKKGFISKLTKLKFRYGIKLILEEDIKISPDDFKIYSFETTKDLTEEFS